MLLLFYGYFIWVKIACLLGEIIVDVWRTSVSVKLIPSEYGSDEKSQKVTDAEVFLFWEVCVC